MKKILSVFGLFLIVFSLSAETIKPRALKADNGFIQGASWTAFQLSIFPAEYCQLYPAKTDVYGIAIGATLLEQNSAAFSVGTTCCLNKNIGFQCALTTVDVENYGLDIGALAAFVTRNYGMQISLANVENDAYTPDEPDRTSGVQIGFLNVGTGMQFGFLNYNPQGRWTPLMLFFNCSR